MRNYRPESVRARMETHRDKPPSHNSIRFGWIFLLAIYVGILMFLVDLTTTPATDINAVSIWEIEQDNARQEWLALAWAGFARSMGTLLWFAPLGIFAALALPRRKRFFTRAITVFAPAALAAVALGYVVTELTVGPSDTARGLWVLSLGTLGGVLGAAVGTAAARGAIPLLMFFPKLAAAAIAIAAVGTFLVTSTTPFDIKGPHVGSEDRRHLVQLLRGHNPMTLRAGETRAIVISSRDIELMLASGLSLVGATPPLTVETRNEDTLVRISAHVPYLDRFINLTIRLRIRVERGILDLGVPQLRLGSIRVPGPVRGALAKFAETLVQRDETLSPVLSGIDDLVVGNIGVAISYRRMDLQGKFLPTVLARLGPGEDALRAARAQLAHFAEVAPGWAHNEALFEKSLQTAFELAKNRSETGNPIAENSGALLALSTLLGHPQLSVFAGLESEAQTIRHTRRFLRNTRLRGRRDWSRHFFVSAGLMQLSTVAVSDAVGLLKEELDADMDEGGSGFSFADLLADRAGTMFARAATLDVSGAERIQAAMSSGIDVSEVFPPADGLREGLADDVLRRDFGGVGGDGYQRVIDDIEARLSRCPLLRPGRIELD